MSRGKLSLHTEKAMPMINRYTLGGAGFTTHISPTLLSIKIEPVNNSAMLKHHREK